MPFMQYPSPAFLPPSDAAEFLKFCRDNNMTGYSYSWKLTPTYGDLFADYSGMRVGQIGRASCRERVLIQV